MKTLGEVIKERIQEILKSDFGYEEEIPDLELPKNLDYGELSSDIAFKLAHIFKKSPNEIAQRISEKLSDFGAEIKGGFINFKIPFEKAVDFSSAERLTYLSGKKILCEFVSANPTGPLHIGHGRIAAVGNAISNILEFCGADVVREFYINDAGEQIEKLGLAILGKSEEYKGKYIEDIKKKIDIEGKEPGEIGYIASRIILGDIKRTLERFGLKFDSWISEREVSAKYFQKAMELMKDYIYSKDGAYFLRTTHFGDEKDRVVIKSDGKPTYFGNDCAYHLFKVLRNFDEFVQVWGADHHGYIKRIESALTIFGFKGKFVVKLVQMVNLLKDGKPVQMSKREGTFITLDELIDEVGADAAKFIYLTRTAESHLDFDIDLAKKQSLENPVFYVQYAHARICSLFREARNLLDGYEKWKESKDFHDFSEKERKLVALSSVFYDVLLLSAKRYEPSIITSFLISLAREFHSYYQSCRILVEDRYTRFLRLFVCETVKKALKLGLSLLGVSAPERM